METNGLLDSHLKQLRLPTFLKNYAKFAEDAVQNNLDFHRYLLALAEQEVAQRERNRIARELHDQVTRFANVLKSVGLQISDTLANKFICWMVVTV